LPRIFFATDIHGSEVCWKKFITGADFYKATLLILGGDMTGKALVPIITEGDGTHTADFQDNHLLLKKTDELAKLEKKISDKGYYPVRLERVRFDELSADTEKLSAWSSQTFGNLMIERVGSWMNYAEEKLRNSGVQCYVCPGNDDMFDIDKVIQESKSVINAEGKLVQIAGDYELLSTGWSTPTPWKTYRECSEDELAQKIESMTSELKHPQTSIFNFHDPPVDSGLDEAPALTKDLDLKGGGKITKAVGSVAVRQAIGKLQPLLGLHGHIHESKGIAKIGRTICINPGSVYEEGTLMGAIADLRDGKVERYSLTAG
jgi:Icc-related predicted phosphoesterase